ncbi:hypothetical protein [Paenibacillus lautus]|uniref:hypothetical protein n=1 Tax=Paenibacillus lautus TaxID=1401 RepID=UPI002DB8B93A|nr:hypothetical protein [Paenibacillus lautus]MEC0260229.1 hypothetical protein [Paenibacillus lautus]
MKKMLVTMLVVILTSVGLHTGSDSNVEAAENDWVNGFPPYSEIVNTDSILSELTEEEYHEAVRNAIPIESLMVEPTETQPEGNIKPMANMSWVFDNLQPPGPSGGAHFSGEFTSSATKFKITVVQWATNSNKAPDVHYTLVNRDYFGKPTLISGRFTHTNTTAEIWNVPPGTYQVMVTNMNDFAISGNGYIDGIF